MKLYSIYEKASMSMGDDNTLSEALTECIRTANIQYVIETGTYLGLGSTRTVANAFIKAKQPNKFITIEANWSNWRKARKNLSAYEFVSVLWGKSVKQDEAIRFINNDYVLQKHEEYPDIWIDDTTNPREFYTKEIQGKLGDNTSRIATLISECAKPFFYSGEDLLRKYLIQYRDVKPLVVLDSAGGIGYLEFSTLLNLMAQNTYFVLLDDIHHLKHFRSFQEIRSNSNFQILASNKEHGWLLAKHR